MYRAYLYVRYATNTINSDISQIKAVYLEIVIYAL